MDKIGADFEMNVNSIRERLGVTPVAIQYPVGEEDQHKGVVDLIKMKAAIFDEESKGQKYTWVEIPADIKAKCVELREKMIEACADVDDAIMAEVPRRQDDEITRERDRRRAPQGLLHASSSSRSSAGRRSRTRASS